jgi:hypothetical protein
MRRVRVGTLILLLILVALGCGLVVHQRREGRLRAALALYKRRSHQGFVRALNRPVLLELPEEVSLGELVEEIKVRTHWPGLPNGLPIFIDADGLREAGTSWTSLVQESPSEEPLPLLEHLRLMLEPLGLAYQVKDGAILITSRKAVDADPTSWDQAGEDGEDPE